MPSIEYTNHFCLHTLHIGACQLHTDNIALITIVILVLFYRNTNNHAISRYRRICRNHSAIWRLTLTHIDAYRRIPPCSTPPSGGTPWDIDVIYTPLKSAFNGLQFRRWYYRFIFIRLAVVASQSREITRNSDKIWPYTSSKSSKVVDFGVNRKPMYDFLLVINSNFGLPATVFDILMLKATKSLNFHTPPFFEAPVRGTP